MSHATRELAAGALACRHPHRRRPRPALLGSVFALAAWLAPFFGAVAVAEAPDWPQYRGPERHGTTSASALLESWGEEEPRLLWKRGIGDGFSAVSAVGERLFTMAVVDVGGAPKDAVLALDAGTGEEIWRFVLGAPIETEFGDGPRSTPTVAGGRVYAISSRALLVALDAENGRLLWRRDLLGEQAPPRFGYASSPLVDAGAGGGQVIVEAGSQEPGGAVAAFDAESGELRWRALDGGAGYASPIVIELGGVRQYVFARRQGPEVVSLRPDGEVLWRHGIDAMTVIPMPIFIAPDLIFVSASDDGFGGLMLRVAASSGQAASSDQATEQSVSFEVTELWRERLMRNHFNTSVVVGDHLYGFDNATFKCLDAHTGERRWAKRGFGKGSLIAAGDLLYVLGDDGTLALVRATPEAYTELGVVQALAGKAWTAPALQRGRLFVRDQDEIAAFDVSAEGEIERQEIERKVAESSGDQAAAVAVRKGGEPVAGEAGKDESEARVAEILARHAEARGGREAWQSVETLRLEGTYAAFSETGDFTLVRRRPHLYRLDFTLLGAPAVRARSVEGPWMLHKLLSPQPAAVEEDPYRSQLERESLFPPLLLETGPERVRFVGEGDIGGRRTLELEVKLGEAPESGAEGESEPEIETWHLDAETYLEVAVDSQVQDLTQLPGPMRQRLFYDDFRRVGDIVLPFSLDWEFGARLESMRVESAEIDPELKASDFGLPPAETKGSQGSE